MANFLSEWHFKKNQTFLFIFVTLCFLTGRHSGAHPARIGQHGGNYCATCLQWFAVCTKGIQKLVQQILKKVTKMH